MTPEPRNVTLLDNTWHLCTVPPLIDRYVKLYKMIWNICVDETSLSSTPKTNVLFVLLPFTIFTAGSTTTLFQHVLHIFGGVLESPPLVSALRPPLSAQSGWKRTSGRWDVADGGKSFRRLSVCCSAWMAGSSRSENCRNFSRVRQRVCLFIAAANLVDRDLFFKARNFVSS